MLRLDIPRYSTIEDFFEEMESALISLAAQRTTDRHVSSMIKNYHHLFETLSPLDKSTIEIAEKLQRYRKRFTHLQEGRSLASDAIQQLFDTAIPLSIKEESLSAIHTAVRQNHSLLDCGFNSILECLEALHHLVDNGGLIEHLNFQQKNRDDLDLDGISAKDYTLFLDLLEKIDPSCLKTLSIPNWQLENKIRELSPYLERFSNLESLNLEENFLGYEDIDAIAAALGNLKKLKELNLSWSWLDNRALEILAPCLTNLTQLEILNLSRNSLKDIEILAPHLEDLKNLKELNLDACDITSDEIELLIPYLNTLKIKSLHLDDNSLSDKGLQVIAENIDCLSHIEELHLESNYIGKEGFEALANSFEQLSQIKKLYLSCNTPKDEGIEALSVYLPDLKQLQGLYLQMCDFGGYGARVLASYIKETTELRLLNIKDNYINQEGLNALKNVQETLINLDIVGANTEEQRIS